MSIKDIPFLLSVSPLVPAYARGEELKRVVPRLISEKLIHQAKTGKDLMALLDQELLAFNLGVPLRCQFIDGADGCPIDPEYAEQAVLIIMIVDGTGTNTIKPTCH